MIGWGERQFVFVTGEAGIGKTTLLEAFEQRTTAGDAGTEQFSYEVGRCVENFGEGEPYLPVLEALSRLGKTSQREELLPVLRRYAPSWLFQMPGLTEPDERASLQQELVGVSPARMHRELAEALEAFTARVPLVLILEDPHWSDHATIGLLSVLARRQEDASLMVVSTFRPIEVILAEHPVRKLVQQLAPLSNCCEIPLELLDETATQGYRLVWVLGTGRKPPLTT